MRPAAVILPDGSIHIQSRHEGATHHTVIPVRMVIDGLPITSGLKKEVLSALKGG